MKQAIKVLEDNLSAFKWCFLCQYIVQIEAITKIAGQGIPMKETIIIAILYMLAVAMFTCPTYVAYCAAVCFLEKFDGGNDNEK